MNITDLAELKPAPPSQNRKKRVNKNVPLLKIDS